MSTALHSLPEIGPVLTSRLTEVGIPDAETLRKVGAQEAFQRIREQLDPGACIQEYTALECGTRGIRTRELSPADRESIRAWFKSLPK